jgi:hypothetical protein
MGRAYWPGALGVTPDPLSPGALTLPLAPRRAFEAFREPGRVLAVSGRTIRPKPATAATAAFGERAR